MKIHPSPAWHKSFFLVTRNLSSHIGVVIGSPCLFYFSYGLYVYIGSSSIIRCTELRFGDFGIRSVYICKQVTKCQTLKNPSEGITER